MLRNQTHAIAQAVLLLAALTVTPAVSLAQAGTGRGPVLTDPLQVRTFMLQSLAPKDAASLVAPYVGALPTGGVYEAGGINAITVRGTPEILSRVDSLLKANDRPRTTITLRFQLIAASDSAVRDPAIAGLDAELHGLLRFAGYRLLAQGTTAANDQQNFELTLGNSTGAVWAIAGRLNSVQVAGGKGNATLTVHLSKPGRAGGFLLSTGLTVPLGQTVVIGSASDGGLVPALVLAVRPELTPRP